MIETQRCPPASQPPLMADPEPRVPELRFGGPTLQRQQWVSPATVESRGQPLLTVEEEVTVEVDLRDLLYIIAHQPTVFDAPSNQGIDRDHLHTYSNFICPNQDNGDPHRKRPVTRPDLVRAPVPWTTHPSVLLLVPVPPPASPRPASDPYRRHPSQATLKHAPRHCPPHPLVVSRLIEQL